jgi:signal peptidase
LATERETESGGKANARRGGAKSGSLQWVGSLVFYLVLAMIVVAAFSMRGDGAPRSLFGFSLFTVLTTSMQSEIPKDSLVLDRQVDPAGIQIGDDVTYLREADNSTVTHRVIGIYENYGDSGLRAFQTQGIENSEPDEDVVFSDNIVGKVIFHNYEIGAFLRYVQDNPLPVLLFAAILLGLAFTLRRLFGTPKEPKEPGKEAGADVA